MDLSSDLRIAISATGDPPHFTAVLTPLKDGQALTDPSEPISLVDGLTIMYGPIGLEYTVQSEVSVYPPDQPQPQPKQPEQPATPKQPEQPPAKPKPNIIRPGR